jgi:hypothetical protein
MLWLLPEETVATCCCRPIILAMNTSDWSKESRDGLSGRPSRRIAGSTIVDDPEGTRINYTYFVTVRRRWLKPLCAWLVRHFGMRVGRVDGHT